LYGAADPGEDWVSKPAGKFPMNFIWSFTTNSKILLTKYGKISDDLFLVIHYKFLIFRQKPHDKQKSHEILKITVS